MINHSVEKTTSQEFLLDQLEAALAGAAEQRIKPSGDDDQGKRDEND